MGKDRIVEIQRFPSSSTATATATATASSTGGLSLADEKAVVVAGEQHFMKNTRFSFQQLMYVYMYVCMYVCVCFSHSN